MDKKISDEKKIKMTVHIPENIPEYIKRKKINFLYDALKPKTNVKKAG